MTKFFLYLHFKFMTQRKEMCMFIKICAMSMCIFLAQIPVVFCQSLDGSPYDPERDSNIDMFMGNWKDSIPKDTHGSLIERDILTKGDALNPPRKGAVFEYVNRFTHGTLSSNSTTASTVLKGEQEIFYILSGRGLVKAGETKSELFEGICFFIPENLEFTITTTGGDDLTMYIISEPVPEGFTPRKDMLVKNEYLIPFSRTVGHWSYQEKDLLLGYYYQNSAFPTAGGT